MAKAKKSKKHNQAAGERLTRFAIAALTPVIAGKGLNALKTLLPAKAPTTPDTGTKGLKDIDFVRTGVDVAVIGAAATGAALVGNSYAQAFFGGIGAAAVAGTWEDVAPGLGLGAADPLDVYTDVNGVDQDRLNLAGEELENGLPLA